MKKYFLLGSLTMALFVAGCTTTGAGTASNTEEMAQETAPVEEPSAPAFATLEERIAYLEAKLQNVYFDYDKFDVRSDMIDIINENSNIIKDEAGDLVLRLEGNTDEWGSGSYNFALGTKRVVSVTDALKNNGIYDVLGHSYGETNPVCSEKTQECWSKNRRVEFKLLPKE